MEPLRMRSEKRIHWVFDSDNFHPFQRRTIGESLRDIAGGICGIFVGSFIVAWFTVFPVVGLFHLLMLFR